ncbi:MAG TPA: RNA 2',3'-cyclic phosphodiesterase [Pleomorphomonadaceae bacterium]|nr:RNA 2',3'-cyclic phosphodiesterase [Pleomorphomonadaceae bacterium]
MGTETTRETWRCFVGIPVGSPLRKDLQLAVARWRARQDAPDLRWSEPDGWHVTLAFLGNTDPSDVPGVVSALHVAADGVAEFQVETGGVGAFPRPGAAQAIWYGMSDPHHQLTDLAARVQAAVRPSSEPARFRPHLTLARSRVRRGEPLGSWLATLDAPSGALTVSGLTLFRSHLGRGPARYEVLARLPLSGAGSGRG